MIWTTRQAPLWVIAAVAAVSYAMPPFFLFFVDGHDWFHPLRDATAGLINVTFQNYAIMLPAIVGGLILLAGRLRPRDVGLILGKLVPGIAFTVCLWAFVNMFIVIGTVVLHLPLEAENWSKFGVTRVVGEFIGQVFGNAIYEEIVFRGFLTVQLILLFQSLGRWGSVVAGVVAAQAIFASIHIFVRLYHHENMAVFWVSDLPLLFATGMSLAVIYLATENLFVATGTHVLINTSMQVVHSPTSAFDSPLIALGGALIASLIWYFARARGSGEPQLAVP